MRLINSALALVVCAAACGGSAASPAPTTTLSTPTTASIPPTSPPTTSGPATTQETSTTTTEAQTTTTLQASIAILGPDDFVGHTANALDLLQSSVPDWYAQVLTYINTIESVSAGSGMDVFTKTFQAGDQTAYAPGYSPAEQVVWFAGAIVHDSCHSRLYADGQAFTGKDAELECLEDQLAALQTLDPGGRFFTHVQGLIDGVDDPANAYWTDPNRHW